MRDGKSEKDRRRERRQAWDSCRVVPIVQDEQKPRKRLSFIRIVICTINSFMVIALGFLSKSSLLLLITASNRNSKAVPSKPYALLFLGCSLIAPSIFTLIKALWKITFKDSKTPKRLTLLWVIFTEFLVAFGTALLILIAMPDFDVLTNVAILNTVGILSAMLQMVGNIITKERTRFTVTSLLAVVFMICGYVLFIIGYLLQTNQMGLSIGLAIVGTLCISFNWWENYSMLFKGGFLQRIAEDIRRSRNMICIISSVVRIAVTAAVLGAYVKLSAQDWSSVLSPLEQSKPIILSLFAIQVISTALCHGLAVAACKMHEVRRGFVAPLWLISPIVLITFPIIFVVHRGANSSSSYCYQLENSQNVTFFQLLEDVDWTICARDIFQKQNQMSMVIVGGSLFCWWIGLVLCTIYTCFIKVYRIERSRDLFVRQGYEAAFIDQGMLLNTRFKIQLSKKASSDRKETVMIKLCATMWHETYDEMMKIIISMFRMDKFRPRRNHFNDVSFDFHIFFDDSFYTMEGSGERHVNEYVETLAEVINEVYMIFSEDNQSIFKEMAQLPEQKVIQTPYGGRIRYTLPHGNILTAHLKDKQLIRHRKRWSQVMYLYYLLGWKLNRKYCQRYQNGENKSTLEKSWAKEKQNTCILALDGDTDFQPSAVMLLVDRMTLYPEVGAVCGRIHPTGVGPMVWYQKFEYAVGHWLQKSAEHVFGCVLCSPGCFSLFRAEALMDDNVMKMYTTKPTEAIHYLQYDQGEDRWLCTLLLQQGWRVEYNAASDSYTSAPQEFKEFYNQRRRWGPSTLANTLDLLNTASVTVQKNKSISKPYILYQIINTAASILGPATVCLMMAGCFTFVFNINVNVGLLLAILPAAIYLILCYKLKADTQITIAALMSIGYAFLVTAAILSIIGNLVINSTFMTPSGLFLIGITVIYFTTAVLHPQEFPLIIYGLLYFICIPSGYVLLPIYSMVNLNNVSWGTRETASAAKPTPASTPVVKYKRSCRCCCWNIRFQVDEDVKVVVIPGDVPTPMMTQLDEKEQQLFDNREKDSSEMCWISQLKEKSYDISLKEDILDEEEAEFWRDLQERYLKPLDEDKGKQKKISTDLKDLRNKVTFVYFFCNALWLAATFFLQEIGSVVCIKLPRINSTGFIVRDQYMYIDPIGLMFLFGFVSLIVIQFLAMLWHRIGTLMHYMAYNETASKERRAFKKSMQDTSFEKNFL
ncbi:chitin synthase chs-2-like [Brienomyrus brachyistius]|uniref:chitin synthase chs-2-like n=1 Tax=Brienomyrus brachyistius TaxID=42636 RepID=UPI0020B25918|nr:chitin synthase chs-2-like [Brienomyrus brachyistius]